MMSVNSLGDSFEDLGFGEDFTPLVEFLASERDCRARIPFADRGGEATLSAAGFLAAYEVAPLGQLYRAAESKLLIGENDDVFLQFENLDDVNCGDIYTLYTPQRVVTHPDAKRVEIGTLHRVHAEVLITDVDEYVALGTIVQSFSEVPAGALVTDRVPVVSRVGVSENPREIDGTIVSRLHEESLNMMRNEVVFLDRGRADGLRAGNSLWVVRRGEDDRGRPDALLPEAVVGRVIVYSVDESWSTGVLTDAARAIRVGDTVTTQMN